MKPPWDPFYWMPQPVFDPITMIAGASLALGAFGTVSSAMGQAQQGNAAMQAAQFNASIYNQQAQQSEAEAAARADILRRDNARKIGATKAAYGASGVDVNQGTPLDVLSDQATEAELQDKLTRYQGDVTALSLRQRAGLSLFGGQQAQDAGYAGAGTTLLTGAAKLGMGGYNLFGGGTTYPGGGTSPTGGVNPSDYRAIFGNSGMARY